MKGAHEGAGPRERSWPGTSYLLPLPGKAQNFVVVWLSWLPFACLTIFPVGSTLQSLSDLELGNDGLQGIELPAQRIDLRLQQADIRMNVKLSSKYKFVKGLREGASSCLAFASGSAVADLEQFFFDVCGPEPPAGFGPCSALL